MAITKKYFVAFVLTILFVMSFVHCSDNTSGDGINQDWKNCFGPDPCKQGGTQGCMVFCRKISFTLYGECAHNPDQCCCVSKTK
ncbi:PREDICTED: defensin-like protein 115 [Camelina sativa]|uniref:Defensin-like protein 115 n=1 Tax=Camelina sativa TaxID=90675 RepID=A0ABM1QM04_CAMSA|nr:PREDICTED: defensin-like protein 115 [Camelina sativa]